VSTTIGIAVNGDSHPADRADDAFWATVPLQPGDNTVQAIAVLDDATVASAPVI